MTGIGSDRFGATDSTYFRAGWTCNAMCERPEWKPCDSEMYRVCASGSH